MTLGARVFVFAALGSACSASLAFAQSTLAQLTGTVTDPAGAAVVGAAVEATHLSTNYRYKGATNALGEYLLPQLREGEYEVRVTAPGFEPFVFTGVQLVSRDLRRLDASLKVGVLESVISVTAGATLIETETARISDTRSAATLANLPLNSRNLTDFLALTPTVSWDSSTAAQRRYGGGWTSQSDGQIDGISFSDGRGGNQISPLMDYVESFQEVRIDTSNNSAEFGPIGVVTIISKSGTNQLRGSAFDYYSTPAFRARNPFSPARASGIRHTPGVSLGGPVYIPGIHDGRNKTFFFLSLETSRGSQGQDLLTPSVAPVPWRGGDFSALAASVRDPFGGNTPFPGNRIPSSRLNPVSLKIQDRFYPLPNTGDPNVFQTQNYRELKKRPFDPDTYWTARLDHRFSDKFMFYGRYTWNRLFTRNYVGNLPTLGQLWNVRNTRAVVLSLTSSLRTNLVNEFRYGLAFNNNPRNGPVMGLPLVQSLGLTGLASDLPDIAGIFGVSFSGLGLTGITQAAWRHPGAQSFNHQIQDHVSWFRGRHNAKFGMVLGRNGYKDHQAAAALFGTATFSNRFTGHPYGDFLLGIPSTSQRAFPPLLIDQWRWAYQFYVTDQWKITPRLTLDAGLRYEVTPTWRDKTGLQSFFDIGVGKIVIPDGAMGRVSPLMPKGYLDVVEARDVGLPGGTLIETDRNNLAPRAGLAYRPWGNDTVFRAGYGIFYDTVPNGFTVGGVPFQVAEPAYTNTTPTPTVVLPQVVPATGPRGPQTVNLPVSIRRDLRLPYSQQWNLTIQHERWNTGFRLSYIGTNTRQGLWSYDINQPVAGTLAYVDKPRRYPAYPAMSYLTNGAGHQYHSMTLEATRQMAAGLFYQASWVWARDIGDLEGGDPPENAYDRRRERTVWADIPTHRIAAALVYELPFGKGKPVLSGAGRVLQGIVGGWQISTMYYRNSGWFLTPQWSGPDPTGTRYTASRTAPVVTLRPDILRDANLPEDQRSTARWYDVGAFGAPRPGSFGTSAKGVIHGPGSNVVHAGVYKLFQIRERVRLRCEMIATNILNHPNWANPGMNISAAGAAGKITDASGVGSPASAGPWTISDQAAVRSMRAAIRVEW